MTGDPLLPNDWHADPWDDVSAVPEHATEELRPGFDYLRGPVRMVVTMVHELRRRGLTTGCVSMCAGGGMGSALVLELL